MTPQSDNLWLMELELWPIFSRAQLVQTFKPGELVTKEAPFRTLRTHGWATSGVSVVTRNHHHASGRLTIFSVLNVGAARSARHGDEQTAKALATAAAKVEKSVAFEHLKRLLSGKPLAEVNAALRGGVSDEKSPELLAALRELARETRKAHVRRSRAQMNREVVVGRILEALTEGLVLKSEGGSKTLVPWWLAQSAHREKVGDLLALVTDKLDDAQMVVNAVPAIDVGPGARARSPFGRAAAVHELSAADAKLLARRPVALRVLVPVTIDA